MRAGLRQLRHEIKQTRRQALPQTPTNTPRLFHKLFHTSCGELENSELKKEAHTHTESSTPDQHENSGKRSARKLCGNNQQQTETNETSGESPTPKKNDLTILAERFTNELKLQQRSRHTIRLYTASLRSLNAIPCDVDTFNSPRLLQLVKENTPTNWTGSTLTKHISRVAHFANWLHANGLTLHRHTAPKIPKDPKLRDLPTDDDIQQLSQSLHERAQTATAGRARTRTQDALIVDLLITTGARISEILNLTIEDVLEDEFGSRILIRGTKSPAAQRAIATIPDQLRALRAFNDNHPTSGAQLFNSRRHKPLDAAEFTKWLHAYAATIGIACTITPHVLRHRWIFEKIISGAEPIDVMTEAGHARLEMTLYYYNQVRRLRPDQRAAHNQFPKQKRRNQK